MSFILADVFHGIIQSQTCIGEQSFHKNVIAHDVFLFNLHSGHEVSFFYDLISFTGFELSENLLNY